jgi:glycosyltransferase involved in cell wall biosynthesis
MPADGHSSRTLPVSIVMPVRNGAATLAAAMESVRAQTFRDWELIVVDDHSTDDTPRMLADLAGADPRIQVLPSRSQGIAHALETGCAAARGEWIARMDADDVMHPDRLERQLAHARSHPDLGLVSCMVRYGGNQTGYAAHVEWLNSLDSPEMIAIRRFVEAPVAHPSVMFRRSLLDTHGGYRYGDFPEDYELWLRWLAAGVRFGKAPEALLLWNDPPDRLSRTDPRYSVEAFYRIKCLHLLEWIASSVCSGRKVLLWGAGRVTRRRFDSLETNGFRFDGFIDIDPRKIGFHRDGRRVIFPHEIPESPRPFVLVGVGNRGAGALIHRELVGRGWREGVDFVMCA